MLKRETILAIFISTIALLIAIGRPALTNDDIQRTITVSATGSHTQSTDAIYLSIGVNGGAMRADEVIGFFSETELDANVLSEDSLTQYTRNMSLQFNGAIDGAPSEITPSTTHFVIIRNLYSLQDVLVHFADLESTSQVYFQFFAEDTDSLIQMAENDAFNQAVLQAEHLADLSDSRLGEVTNMQFTLASLASSHAFPQNLGNWENAQEEPFTMPPVVASVTATVTFELR